MLWRNEIEYCLAKNAIVLGDKGYASRKDELVPPAIYLWRRVCQHIR